MALKRSQKRLLTIMGIITGIILILGGIIQQEFSALPVAFYGNQICDQQKGCTREQIDQCFAETAELEEKEGWECLTCSIYCPETSAIRTLNEEVYRPNNAGCTYFGYYDAEGKFTNRPTVEVAAKCTLREPKSHDKYVCSDGKHHVFSVGADYPEEIDFKGYDVYWMNELDKLEERKENCGSDEICQQYNSKQAKCIKQDSDEVYVKKDYQGCYIYSNRWEVWWFDSNNKISERVEVCDTTCSDGKCAATPKPGTIGKECQFGACDSDVKITCTDGTELVAYECINNCAEPTTNACPGEETSLISECSIYEKQIGNECQIDIGKIFSSSEGFRQFIGNNQLLLTIVAGSVIILLTLFITRRKRRGGFL